MKKRYTKLVRKTYRYLRHPKRRQRGPHGWVANRIFDRHLWRFESRGVCVGLGFGVFCALLPIPLQMVLATVFCIWKRANIPVAVVACWLSPPVTPFLVVLPAQVAFGHWVFESLGLPASGIDFAHSVNLNPQQPDFLKLKEGVTLSARDAFRMTQEAFVGVLISAGSLGYAAYWISRIIWTYFLHHRVEKWQAED